MIGMSELIVVYVIRKGLEHFVNNPVELQYILGSFSSDAIRDMVAPNHIAQCIDFIRNNKILVQPFYDLNTKHRPLISVTSGGVEDTQFLGDSGGYISRVREFDLPPIVYTEFVAVGFSEDRYGLQTTRDYMLHEKLWPGLIITNGVFSGTVDGILQRLGEPTTIYLKEKIPEGTSLVGWKAQSQDRGKGATVGASIDHVSVQITLTTHGDPSVHRLLQILLRGVLKKNRAFFESCGLQVPTFSYQPLMITDPNEMEVESSLKIETKFTDTWVDSLYDLNDSTGNTQISAIIHSAAGSGEDVLLE